MKPPIWFCRLGSDTDLAQPVIGSAASWTGTSTYSACKFGNGSYSNNNANYITATAPTFTPNAFAVRMTVNTDFSVTNGVASDAANHTVFNWYNSANDRFILVVGTASTYIYFVVGGVTQWDNWTTNVTWSASTNTDLLWVYDRAGIGGGANTKQLFINGTSVATAANQPNAFAVSSATMYILQVQAASQAWDGICDNLQLYDYAMTDVNIRHAERGGLNDQVV